ncbi:MAG: hypothetical protein NVSMB9_27470 [Isosphaeraceae bacterium]
MFGGLYGIRDFQMAVEDAVQKNGFADFIPVGIPCFAFLGALLGAIAARVLLGIWLLAIRVWDTRRGPRSERVSGRT